MVSNKRRKNYRRVVVFLSLLVGLSLLVINTQTYVEQQNETATKKQVATEDTSMSLIGYYYYDSQFAEPAFINVDTYSEGKLQHNQQKYAFLSDKSTKKVQSARWIGQIQINKKDEYLFKTSKNEHILLKIGNKEAINKGKVSKLMLEKGIYELQIEYSSNEYTSDIFSIELAWANGTGNTTEKIPSSLILPPELDATKRETKLIPIQDTTLKIPDHGYLDTDDDGIYDIWEQEGYTVIARVVVPWDEKYKEEGYTKFVSNPYHAHTAADPYSDFEKVTGQVDEGMSWESRNPMIASVPVISVGMERLILSKNITVGGGTSHSESRATSSSSTWSNAEEVSVSASAELNPFKLLSITASGKYTHTEAQTISESHSTGTSWTDSISLNKGETADLNANIRYYNTGTGVAYNLTPTVNLVLDNNTIATITAQKNEIANALSPNETHPRRDLNALALNTLDQYSTKLIPLNYEQVTKLDTKKPLRLEMSQFSGDFVKRSPSGDNIAGGSWDLYIPQIKKKTATITLDLGNGKVMERSIAARNSKDKNDLTPELTLKEALEIAFDAQYDETKGCFYYIDSQTNKKYTFGTEFSPIITEQNTMKEFQTQYENHTTNLFDVIVKPGMAFQIIPEEMILEKLDYFQITPRDSEAAQIDFSLDPYIHKLFEYRLTYTLDATEYYLGHMYRDQPDDFVLSTGLANNKETFRAMRFPDLKKGLRAQIYVINQNQTYVLIGEDTWTSS